MNKKCHAWKRCGGCRFMGTAYPEQLFEKRKFIQSLYPGEEVDMVIGMDDPYHYRNKIYAAFGYDRDENLVAGMYEEESHELVMAPDCLIQNEIGNRIISSIVKNAREMKIEPFDEDRGTGVLRHAYIRVSHMTGKVLLVLVIGSKDLPGSKRLVQKLVQENPEIETIVLNWNRRSTSMVLGERERIIYGDGNIIDSIGGIPFRISSKSFYQVNPVQTEKLYKTAIDLAQLDKHTTVLDTCCGIGTISLLAAQKASEVVGVEINESSIKDAEHNARVNHIKNAHFYCDDAKDFMDRMLDKPDVVIMDPPRSGMGNPFMSKLAAMNPKRCVYISCNPASQAEDLKLMKVHGYKIEKIVPVDLFPFTKHTENIVVLAR